MNVWLLPTANPLWNTLIRSIVMIIILMFGFNVSFYNAYWAAIVHDAISLIVLRNLKIV
jgi:hypothetical protein